MGIQCNEYRRGLLLTECNANYRTGGKKELFN